MPANHSTNTRNDRNGVFISYARSDGEAFAQRLRQQLEQQKTIKLWQDRVKLEGGRDWWLQIIEALNQVQFMVLVATPNALKSEVVRKEWRYARQQGVCVYPIKGEANLDFNSLPRWMRDQHFYDLGTLEEGDFGPEWQKFLADLNKTPDLRRVPFIPYDKPERFVERTREFEQLVALLCDEKHEEPIAITAALRGAFGYGKTTLAQALCHDQRIQDAFDDGIVWVTLGQTPDLNAILADLIETLSGYRPSFSGIEFASVRLKELLADRDLLIVIDDVWNRDHLLPFLSTQVGGDRCARLITTRNRDTLPDGASHVNVDKMQPAEAVAMLRAGLPATETLRLETALSQLAMRLGAWPLVLSLVNGRLRERTEDGESLAAALAFVNEALDEDGITAFDDATDESRNRSVAVTLGLTFKLLSEADLARFHELAIFPEDTRIPLVTVERLWRQTGGLNHVKVDNLYRRFFKLSLLSQLDRQNGTLQLHDAVRTYLIEKQKEKLPSLHNQLLDAHAIRAWSEMAETEPYLWDHLAFHLIEAGRVPELVATVKDWRYLVQKTFLRKSLAVEKDFLFVEKIVIDDEQLSLLRRNFATSGHLLNRCESTNDVEITLFNRLLHIDSLQTILQDLKPNLKRPYIIPLKVLPDLPFPELIRALEGPSGTYVVRCCAVSASGKLVVSVHSDSSLSFFKKKSEVLLWDSQTGQLLRSAKISSLINNCGISPDEKTVNLTFKDKATLLWDIETGDLRPKSEGQSVVGLGQELSDDGTLAISASDDNTVRLWFGSLPLPKNDSRPVYGCSVSDDGKLVVSASHDNAVRLWNAQTGQLLHTLEGHLDQVNACATSADGKLLVSASDDNSVRLWDGKTGQLLQILQGHLKRVNDCKVSADGKLIVSASEDNTLRLWDGQTGQMLHILEGHSWGVNACAISADGKLIVSASGDSRVRLWDSQNGQLLRSFELADDETLFSVYTCAVSADGKLIVTITENEDVLLWDGHRGQYLRFLTGNTDSVLNCAVSSNGSLIVTASSNGSLRLWNSETGTCLAVFHADGPLNCCSINAQTGLIIAGGARGIYFLRLVQ